MKKTLAVLSILLATSAAAETRVVPQKIFCSGDDINTCRALDGDMSGFQTDSFLIYAGTYEAFTFRAPTSNKDASWSVVRYMNHSRFGDVYMNMESKNTWKTMIVSGTNWQKQGDVSVCSPLQTNLCPLER